METFVVARNPEEDTALPYLVMLPLDGGIVLKTRDRWPSTGTLYCHPWDGQWTDVRDVVEEVGVRRCARRGAAIDLILDRGRFNRSQFVFTRSRGRPVIFWQSEKSIRSARPGVRVPRRRASGLSELLVVIDSGERYPYKFAGRPVTTERRKLVVGDYGVLGDDGEVVAAVERKTIENMSGSMSDGSLGFQMAELSGLQSAAVVVEGRYSQLFKSPHVRPGFLPELAARLQVRYPSVPIVYCETRKLAEEWTYRFLGAAAAEFTAVPGDGPGPPATSDVDGPSGE